MQNAQIKSVQVNQVDVGEWKTAKNQKQYCAVGIKTDQGWRNNIFWDGKQVDTIKAAEGGQMEIVEYEEDYHGKTQYKFKLPTKTDKLELVVTHLNRRMDAAAKIIQDLRNEVAQLKMAVAAPRKDPPPPPEKPAPAPTPAPAAAPPQEPESFGADHEPDDLPF